MENTSETIETTESNENLETTNTEQAVNTENAEPGTETNEETKQGKTFTQAELDEIIQKRIERERETATKKAAQEARDAYVAEQGYVWNGKRITTESEYKQALKEQSLIEQYKDKDLPDDVIAELIESKKFREDYEEAQKVVRTQERQQSEFQNFLDTYPDVKTEDIPQSVWEDFEKGSSLVDAYARHENKSLKQKIAELEESKKAESLNEENAQSSTGSISNDGGGQQGHFTREQVSKMTTEEVNKNWAAINQSMKKWE